MAIKTQGSQLYALVPVKDSSGALTDDYEVISIHCINNFNGGGNPADQITIECLEATSREYLKGMRTPGQATFTIDADSAQESHLRLHEMAESDDPRYDEIKFALGWSDGTDIAPTAAEDSNGEWDFVLPDTRTWFLFNGYVGDFPFDFQSNTTVKTNVSVQRSGAGLWVPKAAS